jgi:glycosyltransferase involved in cell wall biosynthesis
MTTKGNILIIANSAWNLFNFRTTLIRALIEEGYQVIAVGAQDNYADRLKELGCKFVAVEFRNSGTNPGRELWVLFWLCWLIRREKINAFLGFTIKPNIYGSMAARLYGIPTINNIAGLGITFKNKGILNKIVRFMYKLALSKSYRVFFQNKQDREEFISDGLVSPQITACLPGSGVDLEKFLPIPLPNARCIQFLLVGRLLWDKGVGEFVEAARIVKNCGFDAGFQILGFLDVDNPQAITGAQMSQWVDEGVVSYLGATDDVRCAIAKADCVVLPSYYREGTPRSLLEAAAMGRPIITTDSIGCRETVDDEINGFLCKPRDANSLADQMMRLIKLSSADRNRMGTMSRLKAETEFDENIVIKSYIEVTDKCIRRKNEMYF